MASRPASLFLFRELVAGAGPPTSSEDVVYKVEYDAERRNGAIHAIHALSALLYSSLLCDSMPSLERRTQRALVDRFVREEVTRVGCRALRLSAER